MRARMADSVTPNLIPEKYRQKPNGVALYVNGMWAVTRKVLDHYPRSIRISVTGSRESAADARCVDVERGDATPKDVPGFVHARDLMNRDHLIYSDRSNVAAILGEFKLQYPSRHPTDLNFWISTLDNGNWTPEAICSNLSKEWGASLKPEQVKAIQVSDYGHFDMSLIFDPRWHWWQPS